MTMPAIDTRAYPRLRTLLAERFQRDTADLDVGIDRIMGQRRDDIS